MLEEGLEAAIGDIRAAAYVEVESFAIFNLVAQMEKGLVGAAPIFTDIKTFDPYPFRRKIHILLAGYPCQPFSVSGELKGVEDARHLWPYIGRCVDVIRPPVCIFENVANHLNIGYETVRNELCEIGYRVEEGLFSASEVGAPHIRKRLFIVAVENTYYAGVRGWFEIIEQRFQNETSRPGDVEHARSGSEFAPAGRIQPEKELHATGLTGDVPDAECEHGGEMAHEANQPVRQEPGSDGAAGRADRWPAGRGEPQFEWEHPRVVKSGLGCTTHGYNFREDLLRMYGNGVVPATAAKAIIHLLKKHFR